MNDKSTIEILEKDVDYLDAIENIVRSNQQEGSFYVCDINNIIEKYHKWIEVMPRIKPYYAVKCNNHPVVLQVLSALGTGFDCASKFEIDQILSLGVSADRIIFAQPAKMPTHISHAAKTNVDLMTFDNELELNKIKALFPKARTIIRIRYDDPSALVVLGEKFGCDPINEAPDLLQVAKQLGINVVGISFHVGSGCKKPNVFYHAIKTCYHVYNVAKTLGIEPTILDIGGGFSGAMDDSIEKFALVINSALNKYFRDKSIQIISEPGTYFVDSAFALACNVHSIRTTVKFDSIDKKPFTKYMYYLNDGAYSSFNNIILWDRARNPFTLNDSAKLKKYASTLWGPTADSCDKIIDNIYLPKLNYDDWIVFPNMGAYTLSSVTFFHGFTIPDVYHIIETKNCLLLKNQLSFVIS